jgi:SOS response regulatory protein OraA/RecX
MESVPEPPDPVDLAARALRHRDRSAHEIAQRLERAGVDPAGRAEALDTLARLGYVDDERFARTRAASLAGRGHGDTAIRFDLQRHGLDGETVDAAIEALEPELVRARTVVERRGTTPRTARHLSAKGFSRDTIDAAVGDALASGDAEAV